MIYCIANVDETGYQQPLFPAYVHGKFEDFAIWLMAQDEYQLDVETPVVESMVDAKLRTIQFGEFAPGLLDKTQWVIEWSILTKDQKLFILRQLNDKRVKKYIQAATFEAQVFMNYGLYIENVEDTLLNEKIIYTGYGSFLDEEGAQFFSLEGIARRRLAIELDKTYQTMFGFEYTLTPGHIVYAAQDVTYLDVIVHQQRQKLDEYYPIPVQDRTVFNHIPTLENEAVLAFAEIMWNGFKVDQKKWRQNAAEAQPIVDKYLAAVNQYLFDDPVLNARAIELGYINLEDAIEIDWNSPNDRRELINFAFPDILGATRPILKKYLKDNPDLWNTAAYAVISSLAEGDYQPFFDMLLLHCREDLIKLNYLIPAGTLRINWNSPVQVLPLLQSVKKNLDSTSEAAMNTLGHPVAFALLDYRGAKMLTTTFGLDFLNKIDADGKVRTRFNQILETGRVSTSDPNMQQVPLIEDDDPVVLNKYRNCFIPDEEDEVIVDSDYSSQELVLIASLSQDPVWMEALRHGHDLHSICAQLVHGKDWDTLALPDCKFVASKNKCKCPGHARLRNGIKTINFGLAYGMSQFKLAATLKISVKAAEALIEKYFLTFPKIKNKLTQLGWYGIKTGMIMTLDPYNRKRFFPEWRQVQHLVEYHISGIKYNSLLGSIERRSKNLPIQGGSADMMKLAMVLVRREIIQQNLRGIVKLKMVVHDQLTTSSKKHFAEQWKLKLTELMEEAAKVIIPSGLLKADTNITTSWSK